MQSLFKHQYLFFFLTFKDSHLDHNHGITLICSIVLSCIWIWSACDVYKVVSSVNDKMSPLLWLPMILTYVSPCIYPWCTTVLIGNASGFLSLISTNYSLPEWQLRNQSFTMPWLSYVLSFLRIISWLILNGTMNAYFKSCTPTIRP